MGTGLINEKLVTYHLNVYEGEIVRAICQGLQRKTGIHYPLTGIYKRTCTIMFLNFAYKIMKFDETAKRIYLDPIAPKIMKKWDPLDKDDADFLEEFADYLNSSEIVYSDSNRFWYDHADNDKTTEFSRNNTTEPADTHTDDIKKVPDRETVFSNSPYDTFDDPRVYGIRRFPDNYPPDSIDSDSDSDSDSEDIEKENGPIGFFDFLRQQRQPQ